MSDCVKFEIEPDDDVTGRWRVILLRPERAARLIAGGLTLHQAKAAAQVASRTAFALGVGVAA